MPPSVTPWASPCTGERRAVGDEQRARPDGRRAASGECLYHPRGADYSWPPPNSDIVIPISTRKGRVRASDGRLWRAGPLGAARLTFYDGETFPRISRRPFIAFHGSWNRSSRPATGRAPAPGRRAGGRRGGLRDRLAGRGERRARPRLTSRQGRRRAYVSDDKGGYIYRILRGITPMEEMTPTERRAFLQAGARTGKLATVRPDGRPRRRSGSCSTATTLSLRRGTRRSRPLT